MPKRIQRKRTKGWRMPENTVSVTRPGKWGNPFKVNEYGLDKSLRLYKRWINGEYNEWDTYAYPEFKQAPPNSFHELRGKDLACFCPLDQPCHADVLLELANET